MRTPSEAADYVRRIKSPGKKAYAIAYLNYRASDFPGPGSARADLERYAAVFGCAGASNVVTVTPENAGASQLAINIVKGILDRDAFIGMRKRLNENESYDVNAFAAACARTVDYQLGQAR